MTDLDGDEWPDHVLRTSDGIWWKRNLTGKQGLLNKITLPQGGSVQIGYEEKYGTRDNPNFKYVMSSVTVDDGTDAYRSGMEYDIPTQTKKFETTAGATP